MDGSAEAERAALVAVELCEVTGSDLHVLHVASLPNTSVSPDSLVWYPNAVDRLEEIAEREGSPVLEDQVSKISGTGGEVAGAHLKAGRADAEIVALAEGLDAGLVVVGNSGRGPLRRTLLGSVSDLMVRHTYCPVLVVRGTEPARIPNADASRRESLSPQT